MPERGKNGRPTWVTQRVWGELKAYVPAHPALCSGAVEALDFYAGRLAGFRTHMRAVAGLHAKARELVRARVAAAVATVSSPETSGSSSPVPPVDAAVISNPQLIIEAAAVLVPVEQLATIAGETAALDMLTRAAEVMSMDAAVSSRPFGATWSSRRSA